MPAYNRMKIKHACTLQLGSDSMLPQSSSLWGKLWREMRKLGQLSERHPLTFDYFRSYPAVVAERQRQLLEKGRQVIHPLSLISLTWATFMILINLAHMVTSTFRVMYVLEPIEQLHNRHLTDHIMLGLNIVCFIDLILRFNIGYMCSDKVPVMSRNWIAYHYIRGWFIWDLVSCLPVAYMFLHMRANRQALLIAHFLPVVRTARLYNVTKDITCFLKLFTSSYILHGYVNLAVVFVVTSHWCSCLIYMYPVSTYYWTDSILKIVSLDLNRTLFSDIDTRYNRAMIISLSAFFGTGFSLFKSRHPVDLLIHSCIIFYGTSFMIIFSVYSVKSYLTIFLSSRRYQGLFQQVEQYMKYRQFPATLKTRVRAFYQYRYQDQYFKEQAELQCLSKELCDKIRLHTCRPLVDKVKLFEGAPPNVVGSVLGCLKPEVYLYNDLVVRAGDIGDCMYFIATGTVAVYSLKGVEVCHLEDGAHFGEIALLMKDRKRVATVVAVETTQLYRLNVEDFRNFVVSHQMLYDRIQALASRRMHETVLVDKAFCREKEKLTELPTSDTVERISEETLNDSIYQISVQSLPK